MWSVFVSSEKGSPKEWNLLDHWRHEWAFLCVGQPEETVSSWSASHNVPPWHNKVNEQKWGLKLIKLGVVFFLFSQISAGEPDPLGDQEVFLWPGRAAAPVSWPRVSQIVSKSPSCKLSRVNHTETQRLFVRAVHPNCLHPFLCFDVESRKKPCH